MESFNTLGALQISCIDNKNCEGSDILSYLQAKKLVCHNFMEAGRRFETPGSKAKDCYMLTAIAVARV